MPLLISSEGIYGKGNVIIVPTFPPIHMLPNPAMSLAVFML